MTAAVHLARAIAYQAEKDTVAPGEAQAALRRRIMEEASPGNLDAATDAHKRLMGISIFDMPASADDLALLIDTICMGQGFTSRAEAWRAVGINPNRGRELFARNKGAIDWPIWFTVRHAAFDPESVAAWRLNIPRGYVGRGEVLTREEYPALHDLAEQLRSGEAQIPEADGPDWDQLRKLTDPKR